MKSEGKEEMMITLTIKKYQFKQLIKEQPETFQA